jgi:hypothetical protein
VTAVATEPATSPAQFAELALGMKLLVRSKVALRQLAAGHHVGVSKTHFKSPEARRIEIAAALWHLLAEPEEDVVIAVPYGQSRVNWLTDLTTVLKGGTTGVQREIAVNQNAVLTRFLGRGGLRWWIAGGKDKCRPLIPPGRNSLLIISDFDGIPGALSREMLALYAAPAKALVVTYAHPD